MTETGLISALETFQSRGLSTLTHAIALLKAREECRQGDLCDSRITATSARDSLERLGLVKSRHADDGDLDRRAVYTAATPKGRKLISEAMKKGRKNGSE